MPLLASTATADPSFGNYRELLFSLVICELLTWLHLCSASGTEDAVRVYAEAATRTETDYLAIAVAQLVYDRGGGVGSAPSI
jgi:hypothetical protein